MQEAELCLGERAGGAPRMWVKRPLEKVTLGPSSAGCIADTELSLVTKTGWFRSRVQEILHAEPISGSILEQNKQLLAF